MNAPLYTVPFVPATSGLRDIPQHHKLFTVRLKCATLQSVFAGQIQDLESIVQESSYLRDEVDILRHTAEKVVC